MCSFRWKEVLSNLPCHFQNRNLIMSEGFIQYEPVVPAVCLTSAPTHLNRPSIKYWNNIIKILLNILHKAGWMYSVCVGLFVILFGLQHIKLKFYNFITNFFRKDTTSSLKGLVDWFDIAKRRRWRQTAWWGTGNSRGTACEVNIEEMMCTSINFDLLLQEDKMCKIMIRCDASIWARLTNQLLRFIQRLL